ncbi:ATP-binding protein [Rhodococcus qingshengii]|uniref:ATP-dependent nuclease n=1 Tax=Rhodococcus qingshengii TaxID=334542 RepID=UPI003017EB97
MVTNADLAKELESENFEPFIRLIRFPRFKNVEDGTSIEFCFPITAIVGTNGTNKTSILRALEGCPDYYNFGNFWFSTSLDPISAEEQHRFIHGYLSKTGSLIESRKMRVAKEGDPDYFEPTRPSLRDGMSRMPSMEETDPEDLEFRVATRWKAIKKSVVYLDFRHDIPAYDLHFHFNARNRKNDIKSKKSLVRRQARHLSETIENLESDHKLHNVNRVLEKPFSLDSVKLNWISKILGRKYEEIRLVKHDFYNFEGYTIRVRTNGFSYSEAFAGSGEYAVIMIVKSVLDSEDRSLIILDEPEVSLHPGAQIALMHFLRVQCSKKHHQVVISTHSAEIIRSLPPNAIKVLAQNAMTGQVGLVSQSSLADEAFIRIGSQAPGHTIYVEDDLARHLVLTAISPLGAAYTDHINIEIGGGEDQIKNRLIPSVVQLGLEALVLLDGDQRPGKKVRQIKIVPNAEILDELLIIGVRKGSLGIDGGDGDNTKQAVDRATAILGWAETNLDYLPGRSPEELLLSLSGDDGSASSEAAKEIWANRATLSLGYTGSDRADSAEILITQRQALARVDCQAPELQWIRQRVQAYAERDGS